MAKLHTHYDNLQVARTASPEVIRAAYKGLTQKWHPDRNPSEERERCTRIMAVLNRAYEVLSDPDKRAEHDRWIEEQENPASQSDGTSARGPAKKPTTSLREADLNGVTVRLTNLPLDAREELFFAVNRTRDGYASAVTELPWRLTLAILLAAGGVVLIGLAANSERWSSDGHWWALAIAFGLLYWGTGSALVAKAMLDDRLAHRVLLTPTHIVETDTESARVWPLLGTKRFQMTVHTRNGVHTQSVIAFQHASGDATEFSLEREGEAELLHRMAIKVLTSFESAFDSYVVRLQESPLFRLANRAEAVRPQSVWVIRKRAGLIAGALAVVVHWLVMLPLNASAPGYQGAPPRYAASSPASPAERRPATARSYIAMPTPSTGWLQRPAGEEIAPLAIHAQSGTNYYMKLVTPSGYTVATMFLRAGQTLSVDVPLGTYRIRYAYGSTWYGERVLFGDETRYTELDETLSFYVSGSQANGHEITLTKQAHGNLADRRLSPGQF